MNTTREIHLEAIRKTIADGKEKSRAYVSLGWVAAELERLERDYRDYLHEATDAKERAEDAECELARLRDGLRRIAELDGGYPDDYCAMARALLSASQDTKEPPMCKADPASVCTCDQYDEPGRCPRRP